METERQGFKSTEISMSEFDKIINIYPNNYQMTHRKYFPQIQSKCKIFSSNIETYQYQQNPAEHHTQVYN